MGLYSYDTAAQPPQTFGVIDAIRYRLATMDVLASALGSGDNVLAHEAPADKPSSGKWIVVRERADVGGRKAPHHLVRRIPVQVMAECLRSTPNARHFLSEVHNRVMERLIDWRVGQGDGGHRQGAGLTLGQAGPTPWRAQMPVGLVLGDYPGPAAYDADDDTYYSTATYWATIEPVTG